MRIISSFTYSLVSLVYYKAALMLTEHKCLCPFCHLNQLWRVRRRCLSVSSSVPFLLLWRNERVKQSGWWGAGGSFVATVKSCNLWTLTGISAMWKESSFAKFTWRLTNSLTLSYVIFRSLHTVVIQELVIKKMSMWEVLLHACY